MMPTISIDRKSSINLTQQIYAGIREMIHSGQWSNEHRLPPSRDLAEELGIARKTVKQAYDQLLIEGYIETRGRHGTFVSNPVSTASVEALSIPVSEILSDYGREVASMTTAQPIMESNVKISLFSRFPDFEQTVLGNFTAVLNRELRKSEQYLLNETADPLGYRPLREAIAAKMAPTKEIRCTADQVCIVPGFSVALDLITRIHVNRGDCVLVEEPCYPGMRENAIAYGARLSAIPADAYGLITDRLPQVSHDTRWKLAFSTPGHHFPTGGVLPLERRQQLLQWAAQSGAYIVEDDYDSEFTYRGQPAPALKSLDKLDRVIYVSSFKKLVPPGISVDYLILPRKLVSVYRQVMQLAVTQADKRTQAVLAQVINSGEMAKHIRRLKPTYAKRRQLWMDTFHHYFGDKITICGENSGLHFLIRIKSSVDVEVLVRRAMALGVEISHTRDFYSGTAPPGEFIIGFGCVPENQIKDGVKLLKKAFLG